MTDYTKRGVTHELAENFREEGRRDILREIAELMARRHSGPFEYDEHCCVFDPKRDDRVSLSWSGGCSHPDHAPDCLWVRAQIARPEGAGE